MHQMDQRNIHPYSALKVRVMNPYVCILGFLLKSCKSFDNKFWNSSLTSYVIVVTIREGHKLIYRSKFVKNQV